MASVLDKVLPAPPRRRRIPLPSGLSEEERRAIRLQRNREAAQELRDRRRRAEDVILAKEAALKTENESLSERLTCLSGEQDQLKHAIRVLTSQLEQTRESPRSSLSPSSSSATFPSLPEVILSPTADPHFNSRAQEQHSSKRQRTENWSPIPEMSPEFATLTGSPQQPASWGVRPTFLVCLVLMMRQLFLREKLIRLKASSQVANPDRSQTQNWTFPSSAPSSIPGWSISSTSQTCFPSENHLLCEETRRLCCAA